MNYYLVKILINDKGQDGTSISVYSTLDSAIVAYHQTLATWHNAQDVVHGVVEILDGSGAIVGGNSGYREEVNHPVEPTPEPSEVTE